MSITWWRNVRVLSTDTFVITNDNAPSGYAGDREIDVIEYTPEPSSLVLCGLGALGLMFVARRRRQA